MDSPAHTVDILHPYASLKWRECRRLPVGMLNAQAVWLGDKLYVGGGVTIESGRDAARLYIYIPTTDTWRHIDTPVNFFALVTYHSQLVLVGGREYVYFGEKKHQSVTNKLWTLTEHDQWRETLPPMTTKHQWASAMEFADNILVAGGKDDGDRNIDIVEVYNGHHWARAQCLPKPCYCMKATVLNGHWYLMGGDEQGKNVYYASLDSLVASCQPSEKPLPSVWKRLRNVPNEHSSTAVFGNRLVAIRGGEYQSPSSYIHAYSPYTQSWIHVGNVSIILSSTCTTILPTGDLMVIGGWSNPSPWVSCVYKASLNVTFDSDSHFTMEILSQLKQIGITPLRELEAYKRSLQSVVGIDKVDLPIDNSFSLLKMWVKGYGSLRPTWRHFFWALREIKLNHLADQIEAFLDGVAVEQAATSELDVSPGSEETKGGEKDNKQEQEIIITAEEEKHIAAVQKAMEERGMLDHTIVHGVFVGPARSGKNSLMERLLGRMPSSVSPSTGVAESVVQVKVIQKSITIAANVEESIWSVMDYDDEAIKLMLINSSSENKVEIPVLQTEDSVDIVDPNASSEVPVVDSDIKVAVEPESEDEWFEANDQPVAQSSSIRSRPKLPDSYVSPLEIVKVALRKKGKKGLEILQQHFQKTWSLYLTNTGGQMEFQEVLPLLVSGPSMFFFTFRLDRDINERYIIEYELYDGTSAKPYTSSLTIVEGLLQTLATIAAMGTFVYRGLLRRKVPLRPKVFIIGTHKDKLDSTTVSSDIAKIDQRLQAVIQSTSHYEDLVEFASPSQLIFAVNNFSESDADFKNIRVAVERVIVREDFQMTSPAHWLIFSLAVRSIKSYVISHDLCLDIARQCGLADDELDEALHFIHSKMGLIRYFPYEDVKDLVVIHPQFLFDKVTELIVDTFTFEKAGKHSMDEFKQKGVFSLGEFEKLSMRKDTSIMPFQFAKLLERLRIAAPFEMNKNRMYFFPCVLAHTAIAANFHQLEFSALGPKLMITFKCGYCPKGVVGALIKYLMANEMGSSLTWKLRCNEIFRNQVSFRVGPLDTVVLKLSSTHLEIIVCPKDFANRTEACPLTNVCCAVREALETGIRQVTEDINYVDAQHYVTFPCGCRNDHPGVLEFVNGAPFCLTCSETDEQFELPAGYKLWQISDVKVNQIPESPGHALQCQTRLMENHHPMLLKQLTKCNTKWQEIASSLGFLPAELKGIQAKPLLLNNAPTSWLSEMLVQWLQWAPSDSRGSTSFATLEDLKTALSQTGLGAIAHDLKI